MAENRERKERESEEKRRVYKANYGPEETDQTQFALHEKRETEKQIVTSDLQTQIEQKQKVQFFNQKTEMEEGIKEISNELQ